MIAEVLPIPDLEEAKHTQGLLLCTRMVPMDKLTSKTLSDMRLRIAGHIPTAQTTLQTKFPNVVADDWKSIYLSYRKATKNAYARSFQYKILNNVLYLNKRLALFGLASTSNCSFCVRSDETMFVECSFSIALWHGLVNHFAGLLVFPPLNPQSAYLGYLGEIANSLLLNHILLIYKLYIYNARESKRLSIVALMARIKKIFELEIKTEELLRTDNFYSSKWQCIADVLR